MFRYFQKHAISVLGAIMLLIVNSVLQVFAATKMAELANCLIAKDLQKFLLILSLIFALWVTSFIISFFESYVEELATQNILTDIRDDIISSLISISQAEFKQKPIDYYESYLQNDVNLIQKEGLNTFFLVIRFVGNAVFALVALYFYSYLLFLTAALLVLLIILVPRLCKKYLTSGVDQLSNANEQFLKNTSSGLHGYETLYAFNALKEIKKMVATGSQVLKKANVKNTVIRSSTNIITGLINIGSQLLILGVTGILHFQGVLSAGAILATAELASKVFDSAGIVNRYFAQMLSTSSIFAKFDRLKQHGQKATRKTTSFPLATQFESLEFKNVSFAYPNSKKQLLHNFSFVFKKGNFYKLNGASGRGKSTLLKLATGQLKPDQGEILLNGVNLEQLSKQVINSFLVYLPQTVTIFPRSIDYNILLGRKFSKNKLKLVKKTFGIKNVWKYDSLSGGQQQRVAIARLLDTKGKLILFDESFSNIDLKTTQSLLRKLLSQTETVIIISHRNDKLADFSFKNLSLS